MDKYQLIQKLNEERVKFDEAYPHLDATKYIATIPVDPYGGSINLPKEKFPEYHKHHEDMDTCLKKYNKLLQQFAKYKEGDIVIVGDEHTIEFGIVLNDKLIWHFAQYDKDLTYYLHFHKKVNIWGFGSMGGGTSNMHKDYFLDQCHSRGFFEEKYILMKVSMSKMWEMIHTPVCQLRKTYPDLFKNYKTRI